MNEHTGKYLIIIGGVLLIAGIVVYFFNNHHLHWLGRLPGDIRLEKENFKFYFPVSTLILINVVIFILIRLWRWLNP
jgi:uncharacterized membrane-anchored protein YitT (DUF2179 family)